MIYAPERVVPLRPVYTIRRLWGPEPISFDDGENRARDAFVPAPVPRPEPPIVLDGTDEKVTPRQVAQLADVANFGPGPAGGVDNPDQS